MVVPPLSPSRGFQQASLIGHASPSAAGGPLPLFIQQHDGHELQIVRSQGTAQVVSQPQVQVTYTSTSTVSASGGTIHHHGQSPVRGAIPPLANPTAAQPQQNIITTMNVQQLQQQQLTQGLLSPQTQTAAATQLQAHLTQQNPAQPQTVHRSSGSLSPGACVSRQSCDRTSPLVGNLGLLGPQNATRTSPAQSPEVPRKRIKLEHVPPVNQEIANHRKLICDERLKQMKAIKESYKGHLTELFFLQNSGNIMDYFIWKKRPTVQLLHFLKSGNLDSDEEEELIKQEKKINNEVSSFGVL